MADTSATLPGGRRRGWFKLAAGVAGVAVGVLLAWRLGAFDLLTVDNIDRSGRVVRRSRDLGARGLHPALGRGRGLLPAGSAHLNRRRADLRGALGHRLHHHRRKPRRGSGFSHRALRGAGHGGAADREQRRPRQNRRWGEAARLAHADDYPAGTHLSLQYSELRLRSDRYRIRDLRAGEPGLHGARDHAYNFAAGSVRTGNLGTTLWYLGIAAVFFVLLSLLPGWLRRGTKPRWSRATSQKLKVNS